MNFDKLQPLFDARFTNVQIREVLEALAGYKVTRIHANDEQKEILLDWCKKNGLGYILGNYKVIEGIYDEKKGEWCNIGLKTGLDTPNALWYIYLSNDNNDALIAREYDFLEKDDPFKIGEVLKIPACCTRFFKEKKVEAVKYYDDDYAILILQNTGSQSPFTFYNNFLSQYFNYSLISHYPCTWHCQQSMKKAKDSLEILRECSKEYAQLFVDNMKRIILFENKLGVHSLKGRIEDNKILYDNTNILHTTDTQLGILLEQHSEISFEDNYKFTIGENQFTGDGLNSPVLFMFE